MISLILSVIISVKIAVEEKGAGEIRYPFLLSSYLFEKAKRVRAFQHYVKPFLEKLLALVNSSIVILIFFDKAKAVPTRKALNPFLLR